MDELKTFIDDYLVRGFGSMNKNDFEVKIFNYLLKKEYKEKSNYDISIALGIPETKVKRLRYEAALKDLKTKPRDLQSEVKVLIANAHIFEDGKKLTFQVEDVLLKTYISSLLKKHGCACDGSFSPEIVAINVDDYKFLLQEIYSKKEYENFQLKMAGKKISDVVKSGIQLIASGCLGKTGENLCDWTLDGIEKLLKQINTKQL